MAGPIHVIGVGADGAASLQPALLECVCRADFLAGGERHLCAFPASPGTRFVLRNNLDQLTEELRRRLPGERCVVLASGDPLFYGIGTYLADVFGPESLRIEPAVSSMQLAFARAGLPWQEAALASIHGRDVRTTLLPLLGQRRIGLFTQDGDGPAVVAEYFRGRGLSDYEAFVGENLGAADERVSRFSSLSELEGRRFTPLNYLVLNRHADAQAFAQVADLRALAPGIPDRSFARPDDGPVVMTRQEVRAVVVSKLAGPVEPGDTLWDIGAGLGTVSVEIAVLRPQLEVVAVESIAIRARYARTNRERFGAYNMRVIEGAAPEALEGESRQPCQVFVGGSGTRLLAILDFVAERLRPGGRLLTNFVTLEHLTLTLQRLQAWGWALDVTEVHISRSDPLAGLTGLKPYRGVFLVSGTKPEVRGA
jgi:precorrin-6Y C5,15-methyltransferase (decarboxylating)